MLEVKYNIADNRILAWNGDMEVKGNLKPREGQAVVILPVDPPNFPSDVHYVDLVNRKVVGNPDYVPPQPIRFVTHNSGLPDRIARIESFLTLLYP